MLQITDMEKQFTEALKSIARRPDIKAYIEQDPVLNRLLWRAAAQYVTGDNRHVGVEAANRLHAKGYAVSLEYIGENTVDAIDCEAAVIEMSEMIEELSHKETPARVSFDLSHIGLSISKELALKHLLRLAEQAQRAGIELFISMEESSKTEPILSVYEQAVALYPMIGITLQAQLHRTSEDLLRRLPSKARVRIVKGAYQEPIECSLPRSQALDERYMELVKLAIQQEYQVSIATHDERLIDKMVEQGWMLHSGAEFEMLYGIRSDLSSKLRAAGYPIRIYLTYGHEWYLYLCHRVAEYPPNVFQAVVAMVSEEKIDPIQMYK